MKMKLDDKTSWSGFRKLVCKGSTKIGESLSKRVEEPLALRTFLASQVTLRAI